MTGRLAGRVAVVTGGASGMGRATVLRFCQEGAKVIVADMNERTGQETLDLAREAGHGDQVRFVGTDVSEEGDVEAMILAAEQAFGGLDVVFNNAGVGGAFGPLEALHVEDWDYTFAVNCRSVFLGIKHATLSFKRQGIGGSIINTASVAGLSGGGGPAAYSASKAAVINLTKWAGSELARDQIRVNAILPGGILTPLVHGGHEERLAKEMDDFQPWPSHGVGDDIAYAALYLASDESRFVTGTTVTVDGGLTAVGPQTGQRLSGPMKGTVRAERVGVNRGTTGQPTVFHSGAPNNRGS